MPQPLDRAPQVGGFGDALLVEGAVWPLEERYHRPPPAAANRATLVGDDREEPGPQRFGLRPEPTDPSPGLQHRLLNGIFGSLPSPKDGVGKPVRGVNQ